MNSVEKEEPIKKNPAWSEDYASGYKNGYTSAKSHWKTVMKNALEEKSRESVNLLRVYPYNLIPLINGEDDESDIRAWEEDNKVYYSPRLIEEVMTRHLTERENKVLQTERKDCRINTNQSAFSSIHGLMNHTRSARSASTDVR